ncbi:NAD(P)-binding protein [Epithele typhae]|uniref:NAD(P)-binding protein n=1 Tax=Epithele typhae TaxID=378194 RepID=UPI002007A834|nr:NAD(P)-binding protein [Epithele typhae]KAH9924656.1 NAD(P)-binding protein [Epithele typhae]
MVSYTIVVGASRGIGIEWVRQLSEDKNNEVFAIVRTPTNTTRLNELAASRSNIYVVKGDFVDAESLAAAAVEVGKITGGKLEVLINNGASTIGSFREITSFPSSKTTSSKACVPIHLHTRGGPLTLFRRDQIRINALGPAHAANAFLPLLRAGERKMIVNLSTGAGDLDMVLASNYSFSAALNMFNVLFAGALREEGFTVLAISPGFVDTGDKAPPTPEQLPFIAKMVEEFKRVSPQWDGKPISPETSVKMMREVLAKTGPPDTGAFVSHFGDKRWL